MLLLRRLLFGLPLILLLAPKAAGQATYPALDMQLLGHWRAADTAETYSGVWGYAAAGREYAIVGTRRGTAFVEVTDPAAPRLIAMAPGRQPAGLAGRSYQTYQNYAYGVAEGQGGHSLQIFDLSDLPHAVRLRRDDTLTTVGARDCRIDNGRLFLAANWRDSAGLNYHDLEGFSLANPAAPQPLCRYRTMAGWGYHAEALVVSADSVFLAMGRDKWYRYIVNNSRSSLNTSLYLPSRSACTALAQSTSRRILTLQPQDRDTALTLLDFVTPRMRRRPSLRARFGLPTSAQPHAATFCGENYVLVAYQQDGVQVFDISDPSRPYRVGFFDTQPAPIPDGVAYSPTGCQDVYANLPSGMVLATDHTGGLFIIAPPYGWTPNPPLPAPRLGLWPNPTAGEVNLGLPYAPEWLTVEMLDALGRPVRPPQTWQRPGTTLRLGTAGLRPGAYWLRLTRPDEPPRLERLVVE